MTLIGGLEPKWVKPVFDIIGLTHLGSDAPNYYCHMIELHEFKMLHNSFRIYKMDGASMIRY